MSRDVKRKKRNACPQAVEGILRKKRPYLIFAARFRPVLKPAPQKPQHSLCLSLVLFECFLGGVQPQDAGHLQQESTTTLSEFRGPN